MFNVHFPVSEDTQIKELYLKSFVQVSPNWTDVVGSVLQQLNEVWRRPKSSPIGMRCSLRDWTQGSLNHWKGFVLACYSISPLECSVSLGMPQSFRHKVWVIFCEKESCLHLVCTWLLILYSLCCGCVERLGIF